MRAVRAAERDRELRHCHRHSSSLLSFAEHHPRQRTTRMPTCPSSSLIYKKKKKKIEKKEIKGKTRKNGFAHRRLFDRDRSDLNSALLAHSFRRLTVGSQIRIAGKQLSRSKKKLPFFESGRKSANRLSNNGNDTSRRWKMEKDNRVTKCGRVHVVITGWTTELPAYCRLSRSHSRSRSRGGLKAVINIRRSCRK